MTGSHGDDDGFSLIELLVASALFSLVILVAGGIFVGTVTAGQQVSAVTRSATDGQLAGTAIDAGIRNSIGFEVTEVGADQLVVAEVAGRGETLQWACLAWYFSAGDGGSIRQHSSAADAPVAVPTAAELASWTLLVRGVEPRDGTGVFAADGSRLKVAFDSTAEDYLPVAIEFTSSRLGDIAKEPTCF